MEYQNLQFLTDENNVVLQRDYDGGDSLGRTGNLYFHKGLTLKETKFIYAKLEYRKALDSLKAINSDGDYVRYSKEPYNQYKDMSRDNKMQAILAMGALKMKKEIAQAFWADVKRFFRTPNGDFIGPTEINMYIRAYHLAGENSMILYPIVCLFDLGQLVNSALISFLKGKEPGPIRRWLADKGLYFMVQDYPKSVNPTAWQAWSIHGENNVGDDILHNLNIILSRKSLPTPISYLSRIVYKRYRPVYDTKFEGEFSWVQKHDYKNPGQYAFDRYYNPASNANPFNHLYRDLLEETFK